VADRGQGGVVGTPRSSAAQAEVSETAAKRLSCSWPRATRAKLESRGPKFPKRPRGRRTCSWPRSLEHHDIT
jgi:hypothetical protein